MRKKKWNPMAFTEKKTVAFAALMAVRLNAQMVISAADDFGCSLYGLDAADDEHVPVTALSWARTRSLGLHKVRNPSESKMNRWQSGQRTLQKRGRNAAFLMKMRCCFRCCHVQIL